LLPGHFEELNRNVGTCGTVIDERDAEAGHAGIHGHNKAEKSITIATFSTLVRIGHRLSFGPDLEVEPGSSLRGEEQDSCRPEAVKVIRRHSLSCRGETN
jgi:hypothetical protein